MRIIDNKKDYYDFIAGINGIDNTIVYDRRGSNNFANLLINHTIPGDEDQIFRLEVRVGYLVYVLVRNEETKKWECPPVVDGRYWEEISNPRIIDKDKVQEYMGHDGGGKEETIWHKVTPISIKVYSHYQYNYSWRPVIINDPILSSFPMVSKFIDPFTVWDEVYNFIASRKEMPFADSRTNDQKIESAGFDRKTSFRNVK